VQIRPEQNDLVGGWRTKGKYTFPVVFVPSTNSQADFARDRFGVTASPTNVLLDSDRRLVFRHLGGAVDALEAEVRELLGLSPFVR
jgi:hypothetical protein